MAERQRIIGGNWKMFKTPSEAVATAKLLKMRLINLAEVDVVLCPPYPDLVPVHEILKDTSIKLGAQNMHWEDEGAFTGEVSGHMLLAAGCEYVIIGHSERRHLFQEQDRVINKKVRQALALGLKPIFCVGETLDERKDDLTQQVVETQVKNGLNGVQIDEASSLVVAYEPVWAIGTGVNATPEQAENVHRFIRELLTGLFSTELGQGIRIQYGGSVKPTNAADLLSQPNIDGALVGGASLNPDEFAAIVKSAQIGR